MGERILVAEDDETTREVLVAALVDEGHEVAAVASGGEFMAWLEGVARSPVRAPDLIALDVCLPGRSGIELLEQLRRDGWTTPVVLMTGFASRNLCARAEGAGGVAVIEKPFELKELRAAALRARAQGLTVRRVAGGAEGR
jgi:CheY-like chemotaxis protein